MTEANVYENALQELNNIKDRESDYAQINALQGVINRMAELIRLSEAMADHIAAAEGQTRLQVWEKFLSAAKNE